MRISDIEHIVEAWAPHWTAWERDNVGLQVGDPGRTVRTVGVALEVTDRVIAEAVRRNADLLVTHHPLMFRPPRTLTPGSSTGRLALECAERKIAVYSAHTNLDVTRDGVSFALSKTLGLRDIRFLAPLEGVLAKIAVFVPPGHEEDVLRAFASAGAGEIGNYTHCSFRTPGVGTFLPTRQADPFMGTRGSLESTEELRIEAIVPRARVRETVERVRAVHQYEEMAYDVYPVDTPEAGYGMGAVGMLPHPQTLGAFLRSVQRHLKADSVRFCGDAHRIVQRVAVCGGSGSDLITAAAKSGADVFVTADVTYHTWHDVPASMALIDAGHWETEHVILEPLARRLRESAAERHERLNVYITRVVTNPVQSM